MDIEVWKDIPGYEGAYQASSLGRIRSIDHYVNGKSRYGKPFKRLIKGRILRPGRYNKDGHVSVVLRRGSNGSPVHQLIALTFLGERPDNQDVRHLDGNPQNNKLNNLAYGTRTQNILDVYSQGKAWRNTTKEQALEVKKLLKTGISCNSISDKTGVSLAAVYAIKQRRCFKWLIS